MEDRIVRTLRWSLVAALTLLVISAAWIGPVSACPGAAKASSSAQYACSKTAKATAAKEYDCVYCDFVTELKANSDKVTVVTTESKSGVIVVFAAVSEDDVEAAQAVASKAYSMMATPIHCSMSRAKMAEKSCDGCKAGLDAFAGAEISFEESEMGAKTTVTAENKEQIEKLQAFFKGLQPEEEEAPKG
jgi:hypothetical protein